MAKYANVLIASCDKGILRELRDNVRELGLFDNVRLAFDGKEALNSIDAIMPELLIVDYILTNIDGLGVVEKVREKYGDAMRVVIVSNVAGHFILSRAVNCGADYICIRPYDKDILLRRIMELMEHDSRFTVSSVRNVLTPDMYSEILSDITGTVQRIGVPAGIKGYYYLRSAIMKCVEDRSYINSVMSRLYPEIAAEFGTTAHCVERNMRHAIEVAFSRGDINFIDSTFGYTVDAYRGKPTNTAFIATIVDKITIKYGIA